MAGKDTQDGSLTVVNVCEMCENRELCPVYMGQSCLLTKEHSDVIAYPARSTE